MFIICLISLKTCSLYVRHTKSGETDISDVKKNTFFFLNINYKLKVNQESIRKEMVKGILC